MSSIKFHGFDDLQKELKRMQHAAEELDGVHNVPFSELFTPTFMRKYTTFASFAELLKAGGFQAETSEEFESIPDEPFDRHIANTTSFHSWEDMLNTATEEYISRKLGF